MCFIEKRCWKEAKKEKENLCIKGVLEGIDIEKERKKEREKSLLPGSLARLGLLLLLVG